MSEDRAEHGYCLNCKADGNGNVMICPLHAAAGELLEVSKQIVLDVEGGIYSQDVGTMKELRAAIKKASS